VGGAGDSPTASGASVPSYHPGLPPGCPPDGAAPMTGTIYRRVSAAPKPITNADFYSGKVNNKDKGTDRLCQRWGTSVWIDIAHLNHDMDVFGYLRKYRFVSVDIRPRHGVVQKTPTDNRPEHRTFWRDCLIDFADISKIIYTPPGKEDAV
jgi:hypothetical protein